MQGGFRGHPLGCCGSRSAIGCFARLTIVAASDSSRDIKLLVPMTTAAAVIMGRRSDQAKRFAIPIRPAHYLTPLECFT